jgi:hypothetical protein
MKSSAAILFGLFLFAMTGQVLADVPPAPSAEFREPGGPDDSLRTLTVAIYLLIVLTVGTVSLMLVLMLWGSRVRREARKPLPQTKPRDPFWYLKAKKPIPGEPEGPPQVSEGKGNSETDQPPD